MESIINSVINEKKAISEKPSYMVAKLSDSIKDKEKKEFELASRVRISVIGVGGAGCNAVTRLFSEGIESAKTFAINTDSRHLHTVAKAHEKFLLGKNFTRGMGAGGDASMGRKCAEGDREELTRLIGDNEIVFIAAGMGGGTGAGASPVIARIAKEHGAMVIGIVTFPFRLERIRIKKAQESIKELLQEVDTLIIIDNNKLAEFAPNLPLDAAFKLADSIMARAVRGLTDSIMVPSLINIDYADVRSVLKNKGIAMISLGEGVGPSRVDEAIRNTLTHPLLEVDYEDAKGAIVHIEGSEGLTLGEAISIGNEITKSFDPNSEVKLGARVNEALNDRIIVTAIITGVKSPSILKSGKEGENENALVL
ncbi:MAG: cell division protein FtsZ [Candidatus Micrarchaeota archaeon]|nr:cell division protein FtsZ [Candidatus Micrarchaeota archaeon]